MTFDLEKHVTALETAAGRTDTNEGKGGAIKVRNGGGYVARFSVAYDLDGKRLSYDSGNFTAGVNKSISIPERATNIHLKVEAAWFIASWSTIFTKEYASPPIECFEIGGTTLHTNWKQVNC